LGGLPAGLAAEGMVGKEVFREQNILQLVLIDFFFRIIKRQTKYILNKICRDVINNVSKKYLFRFSSRRKAAKEGCTEK
jgi:hypothetical protein